MKQEDPDFLESLVKFFEDQMTLETANFLKKKGVLYETIEKFRIGFGEPLIGFNGNRGKLNGFFNHHLIFPVMEKDKIVNLLGMTMHETRWKFKNLNPKKEVFYNLDALDEEEVILCRDVLDVLVLSQVGFPAVCVPEPLGNLENLKSQLQDKRIFICFGNDDAGRKEMEWAKEQVLEVSTEVFLLSLPEGCKSICNFFLEHKDAYERFVELVQKAVDDTLKIPIAPDAESIDHFLEEYSLRFHKETKGIKTGFGGLDRLLLGGLRTGLYLIHGYVSSGKTMFMRQMADQIAEQNIPVVFVSWDMTTFELWARSMARILGVSPREILAGKTSLDKVKEASSQYRSIAEYLFTFEATIETSIDDVENYILEITGTLGKPPVIFIDHFHRIPILDRDGKPLPNNLALVA
ncbi:MAG TPA: DNA primase, partial [Paenibacillaceae bacterium]|nr:DNA primase [Paenibacillaceae bacterium]